MDKYIYQNTLVALRIKSIPAGSIPRTQEREPLQVVTLKHPKSKYLPAHSHKPRERKTKSLQECLILLKGKVRIDLYSQDKTLFKKVILNVGEMLILMNGGYGIHFIEESELFEVKNGPFLEDKSLI